MQECDARLARLRDVFGGLEAQLRQDLEYTRSVFSGEVSYIVRDPMTGRVHRMSPREYAMLRQLSANMKIADAFEAYSAHVETPGEGSEHDFYDFVLQLHDQGLVTLPAPSAAAVYKRHEHRRRSTRRSAAWNFLFLRIPLFSPDAFLERTVHLARPLFTRAAYVAWAALIAISLLILAARWEEFCDPLLTVLEVENIPWLLALLVALKVVHEFGHAYACKALGGSVPQMGVVMIVATPLAYVDATSSWRFPRRRDRILVSLAGMYVESILAALALILWAWTGPSLLNTIAYQSFILASFVTVAFNINPLMKFDGYYVLTDLVGVPNLRKRSEEVVAGIVRRFVLGMKGAGSDFGVRATALLAFFGISCHVYRVFLVLSICAMIAAQFYFVGIFLAAFYVGKSLLTFLVKNARFLLWSPETAPVRVRSLAVATVLFVVLPTAICVVPMRVDVSAVGVVRAEIEESIRVHTPGFLTDDAGLQSGDEIPAATMLATLQNRDVDSACDEAAAELQVRKLEHESALHADLRVAERVAIARLFADRRRQRCLEQQRELDLHNDFEGRILKAHARGRHGQYFEAGDEIAVVASGARVAKFLMTEADFVHCNPRVGDRVVCTLRASPSESFEAVVDDVAVAGTRFISHPELSTLGGGSIVVDPEKQEAAEPYFEVRVRLPEKACPPRYGMILRGRFVSPERPLFEHAYRRVLIFTNSLRG